MIPEFPKFKKIELSDFEDVNGFIRKYPPYSDFNFISMWSWDIEGSMRISQLNGNLVVKFIDYLTKDPFYSFLGENQIEDTISKLISFSSGEGNGSKLKLIHQEIQLKADSSKYIFLPDQDNFDYIYDIKNLYECIGKKYETQRNLLNKFKKYSSSISVKFYSQIFDVKDYIIKLDQDWAKNKIKTDGILEFRSESKALKRIFEVNNSNLFATCVFNNDQLIAFCINELIPDSPYAISHFAKANIEFSGIYSYLLNQNCKYLLSKKMKYLNYEQDLGIPSLRHSKTSFRPMNYLKKYTVINQ